MPLSLSEPLKGKSLLRLISMMLLILAALALPVSLLHAAGKETPQPVKHTRAPSAPLGYPQDSIEDQWRAVDAKNVGCASCHTATDHRSMHASEAVVLACVDCHGGNQAEIAPAGAAHDSDDYIASMRRAHVLPKYPVAWNWPASRNPTRSYALLAKESAEFIRFVNPSDYRVVRESCGACHMEIIEASERSLMATGAMLWGGAAYNNGIVPFKNYVFGESFNRAGQPAFILSPSTEMGADGRPRFGTVTPQEAFRGALPALYPLPTWHTIAPGDVFRVFEDGGRNITPQFPEIGLPNIGGIIQRLEEPGRPDLKQSNRGMATGLRVAIPVLNIHKTRLNDPFLWQMGTNDQPGDYRSSGCAACHVIYANDREPRHSMSYGKCGRDGQTVTADPTINRLRQGEHRRGTYGEYGDYDAEAHEDHSLLPGSVMGGRKAHGSEHGGDTSHDGEHGDAHASARPAGNYVGGDSSDPSASAQMADDCRRAITRPTQLNVAQNGSGAAAMANPHAADAGHGDAAATAHAAASVPMQERERGHPLVHAFTRAIPTAQCMNCHMHQPNIFLNSYLGYTMWDYESDAPTQWSGPENNAPKPDGMSDEDYQRIFKTQFYPTSDEQREAYDRNPEAAAARGLWRDVEFLRNVYDLNANMKDTQFADYHGHGWNFRAVMKRDRRGNMLDADGNMASYGTERDNILSQDDPELFRRESEGKFVDAGSNPGKSVHLMDIHAEVGMQCADCHFAQDSHGNGLIHTEVANAVEIGCKDCHGTPDAYPTLITSNLAASPEGNNLALLRNQDGERRFEWFRDATGRRVLIQRSIIDSSKEWQVSLVKDSVDRRYEGRRDTLGKPIFNPKAAHAKLLAANSAEDGVYRFGTGVPKDQRAHKDDDLACFTCHLSWTTSCAGCHLPIEANWKSATHKYEEDDTRNFATYNPQVARDEMFQLGRHQTTKTSASDPSTLVDSEECRQLVAGLLVQGENQSLGQLPPQCIDKGTAMVAPIRSTSALILSSTNINRERIYIQQPPIASIGYSSQAFAPHFPHTVRKQETKTCSDCHISQADDNNAIMSQLMLMGTNYVNFVGLNAWFGLEGGFEAVRVTEWDEPQAVIGSYLHRYAYPDFYNLHVDRNKRELKNWSRGAIADASLSGETTGREEFANVVEQTRDPVRCLQARGEYMFVAEGRGGFRAYDIASIGNKGFSERIINAPFSSLGQSTKVDTPDATCMALPTNQPIAPERNTPEMRSMNQEQPFSPIYHYAFVTDSVDGLIAVNIDTLADGEFRNNFFKRTFTFNPDGKLTGARHITLGGNYAYITTDDALVVVYLPTITGEGEACEVSRAEGRENSCLDPKIVAEIPMVDPRASALQFRYLWVTDADGLKLFDVTDLGMPAKPAEGAEPVFGTVTAVPSGTVPMADARRIYLARTYAYVAAKAQGLAIVDITRPAAPSMHMFYTANGELNDAEDVIVASTNASAFAYVADGKNGIKVLQLTAPEAGEWEGRAERVDGQPNNDGVYGFSPQPRPFLIAWARTPSPAIALSKGLDRDRGVDETGGQIAIFGRLGSRPFTRREMERLFLNSQRRPYMVTDQYDMRNWVAGNAAPLPPLAARD